MTNTINPRLVFHHLLVPEVIASYPKLSMGAKMTYGALGKFSGKRGACWPALGTVAREIGVSRDQTKRYIRELVAKKFIGRGARLGGSNRYVFLWHPIFGQELYEGWGTSAPPPVQERPDPSAHLHPKPTNRTNFTNTSYSSSSGATAKSGGVVDTESTDDDEETPEPKHPISVKASNYSLSEQGERPAGEPSDTNRLASLISAATQGSYDRKVLRQVADELARRRFTVAEFIDDIIPHLKRLSKRPGAGFFLHHAQVFTPRVETVERKRSAESAPAHPECAQCADSGLIGKPSGTTAPDIALSVRGGLARFCSCAAGAQTYELCAEYMNPKQETPNDAPRKRAR